MKKWICSVCGYTVSANEPPEQCPVCGADKSLFIFVEEDAAQNETSSQMDQKSSDAPESKNIKDTILDMLKNTISRHHLHPISVHIPNGVVPMSFIFVLFSVMTDMMILEKAAFINLVFVLLSMPFVVLTGYVEWRKKYAGVMTYLFKVKIVCAAALSLSVSVIILWRAVDETAAFSEAGWLFILLHIIALASAGIAGFMGSKLVFKN